MTESPGADDAGSPGRLLREDAAEGGRRGRDVAALAALLVALALLWAAAFFSTARFWGEYRPVRAALQEPPPPPMILVPALTLDQARRIIERAAGEAGGSH